MPSSLTSVRFALTSPLSALPPPQPRPARPLWEATSAGSCPSNHPVPLYSLHSRLIAPSIKASTEEADSRCWLSSGMALLKILPPSLLPFQNLALLSPTIWGPLPQCTLALAKGSHSLSLLIALWEFSTHVSYQSNPTASWLLSLLGTKISYLPTVATHIRDL